MEHTQISIGRGDYTALRERLQDLHRKAVKELSGDDWHAAARHLGVLQKKVITVDENEGLVLLDYLLYSYRPRGFNTAELYLRTHRDELDAFSLTLLEHMSRATYTLFRVEAPPEGAPEVENGVYIRDLLTDSPAVLLDRGKHQMGTDAHGHLYAAHLLVFDDFVKSTGGTLPIEADMLDGESDVRDAWAAVQAEPARTDPALRAKLARAIIPAVFSRGTLENVRYQW